MAATKAVSAPSKIPSKIACPMINFALLMTPHSAISLEALWELALPRVIREMSGWG